MTTWDFSQITLPTPYQMRQYVERARARVTVCPVCGDDRFENGGEVAVHMREEHHR